MLTNKDLRQMFNRLNGRYFQGKLSCTVSFADLSEEDCIGICYADERIEVDGSQRKSVSNTETTLLHEMAHAELHGRKIEHHGRVFQKRIDELYKAGAYKGLL